MDTRNKIRDWQQADALLGNGRPCRVVIGYFDPLLAAHARRLSELAMPGGLLLVVVENPPGAILAARARAELVASLAVVDYVLLPPESGAEAWLEKLPAQSQFREEQGDGERTQELIRHIRSRQRSTGQEAC